MAHACNRISVFKVFFRLSLVCINQIPLDNLVVALRATENRLEIAHRQYGIDLTVMDDLLNNLVLRVIEVECDNF